MARMVCYRCSRRLAVDKTGVWVLQTRGAGQAPYKLWRADRYRCPDCGLVVVSGFGERPQYSEGHDRFPAYAAEAFGGTLLGDQVVFDHEVVV